jgi:L-ascorbate metabolism protein UlaG (beta-lactamase superfamily)
MRREVHMNPEEAVKAFRELKADVMVPMHYGSFRLSFEPPEEPLHRLRAVVQKSKIEGKVFVMEEGVPTVF